MADNPFFNANLMALGGQMAQAWQQSIDTWWQGLLGDREKLQHLAQQLKEVTGVATNGATASSEDLERVVQALELIQKRQGELEDQVRSLSDSLTSVVSFLEKAHAEAEEGD